MDWSDARERLIEWARSAGWAAVGVAGVEPLAEARELALEAIDAGRMDGMAWLSHERIDAAADLGRRYPWARSVISLAWPYRPALPLAGSTGRPVLGEPGRPRGRMAAYACLPGDGGVGAADYHDVLRHACDDLAAWLATEFPGVRTKRFIDHGWAMDRPLAAKAGLGFAGKNTFLITLRAGSYVLLAELLTSLPLPATAASKRGCGSCSACLPSCPTGALVAPGVMDATRCIAYLTIEHKGPVPLELREQVGTWVFGCDLCQEACPINTRLAPEALPAAGASTATGPVPFPDLLELLGLDERTFAERFRGTAVFRTGRAGLARNAAIALGNSGDATAIPALEHAARGDPDEAVRDAAAWAVSRLASPPALASG